MRYKTIVLLAFRKISYLPLELPVLTGATFLLFEDFDAFIGAPVLTGFFETASFLILTFFRFIKGKNLLKITFHLIIIY